MSNRAAGFSSIQILLFLNLVIFIGWNFFGASYGDGSFFYENFLVSWDSLRQGRYWTLLTSVFSHNMFLHFMVNMMVLISFGPVVENILGTARFIRFYLTAGIISSIFHASVSFFLLNEPAIPALGASGAIAGVVLLFSILFPKEKIYVLGLLPIPAAWGAVIFIGIDLWGLSAQAQGGGLPIGHGAHLGGALTGIIYYFLHRRLLMSRFRPFYS